MVIVKGIEDHSVYFGTSIKILKLAGELRKGPTQAERILWTRLNKRKMDGLKFRRQHPINIFIADFYCHELRLVIEVDGSVHDEKTQNERDIEREFMMDQLGIKTIRFTNHEIETDIEGVIKKIRQSVKELQNP